MKLSTSLDLAWLCLTKPSVLWRRKSYLFLMSHMRSYSSLLSHLLGSHAQISGHSERLKPYRRNRDLIKLRYTDYRETGSAAQDYLLDKILHNQYAISDSILKMPQLRLVFFLRDPEATYQSIFHMGRYLLKDESYCDLDAIDKYYCERLGKLVEYSKKTEHQPIYLDADDIVDCPKTILTFMTDWLELKSPIRSEYEVFEDSGTKMRGDHSEELKQ